MRRLRWTTFVLVVLAYALSFFHRMAPATIAADLQQTFAASAAMLGGISGLCEEGRWECAVQAIKGVDLTVLVKQPGSPDRNA